MLTIVRNVRLLRFKTESLLSISDRPMTREEAEHLKGFLPLPFWREHFSFLLVGSAVSFAAFFGLLHFACRLACGPLGIGNYYLLFDRILIFSLVLGLAVVAWFSANRSKREREEALSSHGEFLESLETDLTQKTVKVEAPTVKEAVEIEPFDDEGAGFFLEMTDGRVLCVIGQHLDPYAHDFDPTEFGGYLPEPGQNFPCTTLEIAFAPSSGIMLGVTGLGPQLRPRSIVSSHKGLFSKAGYFGPEPDTFYPGPLDAVLEKFKYTERPFPVQG